MYALIILSVLGIIALAADIFRVQKFLFPITLVGLVAALAVNCGEWGLSKSYFNSMMLTDNFALVFIGLILALSLIWFILSQEYIRKSSHVSEYYALIIFGIAGAIVMVSYSNLVMLFLGIEILSISMYVLAGSNKSSLASNEAALKYFLTGAFSTGFLLFGITLLYGVSGTFDVIKMSAALAPFGDHPPKILFAGILFILCGLSFKIAAFPFHFWAPDVYEGSPDIITSFMATVVKVASLAAFFRLFTLAFLPFASHWSETMSVLAILSILAGNITAIFQNNVKRMLAYSGIAHAGYMLLALIAGGPFSHTALFFYSVAYAFASLGALGIMQLITGKTGNADISSLRGLGKKNPFIAFVLSVCVFSLAGIPPTAGFFGKYYLFTAALDSGHIWLVLFAIAGTLISIYYYFRIVHEVFIGKGEMEKISVHKISFIALSTVLLVILILGVAPDVLLRFLVW